MSTSYFTLKRLGFTILQGAAFCLGFVVLLFIALMVWGYFGFATTSSNSDAATSRKSMRPTVEQLVITDTNAIAPSDEKSKCGKSYGQISFVGAIENKGPDSDRYLDVYADMFDEKGVFIFQCQTQLSEGLKSGEKQNFIINCYNWPKEIAERYSTFKIYVRGA